jgi:hypothetical protein
MLFDQLDPPAQGILLAACLDGRGDVILQRLSGPAAEHCREAYQALVTLHPAERRRVIADLARDLLSPLPYRLHRVHPSWIRSLLAAEPPAVAAAVARLLPPEVSVPLEHKQGSGPAPPAALAHVLCRRVLAVIEPMPPAIDDHRRIETPAQLPRLSPARLRDLLLRMGCLHLASAAHHTSPAEQQRLLALFPPDLRLLLDQALLMKDLPTPTGHICTTGAVAARLLLELGSELAAQHLDERQRRQAAQLLPRDEGLILGQRPYAPSSRGDSFAHARRADAWAKGERDDSDHPRTT